MSISFAKECNNIYEVYMQNTNIFTQVELKLLLLHNRVEYPSSCSEDFRFILKSELNCKLSDFDIINEAISKGVDPEEIDDEFSRKLYSFYITIEGALDEMYMLDPSESSVYMFNIKKNKKKSDKINALLVNSTREKMMLSLDVDTIDFMIESLSSAKKMLEEDNNE